MGLYVATHAGDRAMKKTCHFCAERWGDDNLYTCYRCHSTFCFREDCEHTHNLRCAELTQQYETIYESPRGTYTLNIEPREWFDQILDGNPFRCLNCEKTLWIEGLRPMSWIMSLNGMRSLKRLLCPHSTFQGKAAVEYPLIRGFCRHCDSLLELRQWQAIVEYTATPPGSQRTIGNKPRFNIVIHVGDGQQ